MQCFTPYNPHVSSRLGSARSSGGGKRMKPAKILFLGAFDPMSSPNYLDRDPEPFAVGSYCSQPSSAFSQEVNSGGLVPKAALNLQGNCQVCYHETSCGLRTAEDWSEPLLSGNIVNAIRWQIPI